MPDPSRNTDPTSVIDAAVQALAAEIHQPVATVKVVYERELIALQSDARIKDYVALFAGRRAREVLQRGGH
jgi:hypothetical protein